jgi:6-pyruvoyltetrahydropterin/6-carboxytetrahydropterin synthase
MKDTPMFELKVVNHFAAAHQLRMVAKKCENLHGHNWKVEVYIAGEKLNDAGVVMDFGEIKKHLADIVKDLDHTFLNELECFQNENSSSENIARYIAEAMQERISEPGVRVSRVRTWESEDACATYVP